MWRKSVPVHLTFTVWVNRLFLLHSVYVFMNLSNKHDLNSVFSAELMCRPCSPHHRLFYLNVQDVLVDVSIICAGSVRLRLIFNLSSHYFIMRIRMTFF